MTTNQEPDELTMEQLTQSMSAMRAELNECGLGPVAALESHPPDRAVVELDATAPVSALLAWVDMLREGHFGCREDGRYVRLWLRGRPHVRQRERSCRHPADEP